MDRLRVGLANKRANLDIMMDLWPQITNRPIDIYPVEWTDEDRED
jgi:hypothetical protein